MTMGRPHLIGALAMVAASVAYNVWVFTRPARRATPVSNLAPLVENVSTSGPVVTGEQAAAALDPTTLPAPPEIDVARVPRWPRNPFARATRARTEVVETPVIEAAEPDFVVASILHSDARRLAVVNGRIVRAGDRLGSTTILEIQPRAVVVESSRGGRRTLELRAPLSTGGVK